MAKDFNIMDEAKGAQTPIIKPLTAYVTNHFLTIRLSWAGKGTTRIPTRGVYGPIISAISIVSGSFLILAAARWMCASDFVCILNSFLTTVFFLNTYIFNVQIPSRANVRKLE